MPKHKKKWINGKNIVKFRLVPHSSKGNKGEESCDEERSAVKKKDFEEHMKYGIFFDDDYDYMQHLRSLNEVGQLEEEECTIIKVPANETNLPNAIFEVNGVEINFNKSNQSANRDVVPDPEIVAALDGNFDFDNPENILEDDFILKACDGELPPKMPTKSISDADFEIRHPDTSSESDDENDVNDEMDFDDFSVEMEEKQKKRLQQSRICPKAEENSETQWINDKFERLYEEYEDEFAEIEKNGIEPNSYRIKQLADEFKGKTINADFGLVDTDIRNSILAADAVDSNEEFNQIEVEASGPKKVDWDCESILTTYTNIYNHPTIIKDPCRKRKIKPSNDIDMVDIDSQSLASTRTVSTMRPPGETSEERKLRKNAIKELRRERRAEKKSNKLAYKKERLKLFQSGTQVKMRRLV